MTPSATLVLAELHKGKSLRRIDLMRKLNLSRATVTEALDELTAARLVLPLSGNVRYQARQHTEELQWKRNLEK